METNQYYHRLDKKIYLPTFNRYPLTFIRGKGSRIWDVEGKEYIDLLAGIAVNSVGHCHPKVVEAIKKQASELIHISNFFTSPPQVELAEKLVNISGLNRVFLTNSGAESLEGAFKIARKYAHRNNQGGQIISMEGCFHGRTLATIASGSSKYQKGFDPIPSGFLQVPFNDMKAVEKAYSDQTAAIVVEPVQGEGGVRPADFNFLRDLREFCNIKNLTLIFDEVQCGVGRTGKFFAKEHYGVQPDIMTLAKGLGGGVPVGAILATDRVCTALEYGDHGTTFGGNPLVCAAALAVMNVIEEEDLVNASLENGKWFKDQLSEIHNPHIKEVRGMGLMIGMEFDFEAKPLVQLMLDRGIIANATAGNVLRFVPPLNISREDLGSTIRVLKDVLVEFEVNA